MPPTGYNACQPINIKGSTEADGYKPYDLVDFLVRISCRSCYCPELVSGKRTGKCHQDYHWQPRFSSCDHSRQCLHESFCRMPRLFQNNGCASE